MAGSEDREVAAIATIVSALAELQSEAQARVVEYVLRRIGIKPPPEETPSEAFSESGKDHCERSPNLHDIRSLKEQKQPRTANEMAALVAYYLSELAPHEERWT